MTKDTREAIARIIAPHMSGMTREQIEALKVLAYRASPGKVHVGPNEIVDAGTAHIAAWSPANVLKFIEAYEAMEKENKALREALEPLIEIGNSRCCDAPEWRTDDMVWAMVYIADLRRARKALGAK